MSAVCIFYRYCAYILEITIVSYNNVKYQLHSITEHLFCSFKTQATCQYASFRAYTHFYSSIW